MKKPLFERVFLPKRMWLKQEVNMTANYEPYTDADTVAEFLKVKRKTVLDWARRGIIPAHAWGQGHRKLWRFLISEVASQAKPVQGTMDSGSSEIARLEKKCG